MPVLYRGRTAPKGQFEVVSGRGCASCKRVRSFPRSQNVTLYTCLTLGGQESRFLLGSCVKK